MPRKTAKAGAPIPHFALFGELAPATGLPLLHIEPIRARSRRYGWEISEHTHDHLLQLVLVRRGGVSIHVDGQAQQRRGPVISAVPPGVVHAYRFEPTVEGDVVSLSDEAWAEAGAAELQALVEPLLAGAQVLVPDARSLQGLAPLLVAMRQETQRAAPGQASMLRWLSRCLLLQVYRLRAAGRAADAPVGAATGRMLRLRRLIDLHFREQRDIAFYARQLGMTERSLRRLTQAQAACTPGRLVDERIAREARQRLAYTHASVAQIAYALGFEDPAYFSRFLRRMTGDTPQSLRRGDPAPADT
jgi:AraC family transcriptional activator of pobA